MKYAPGPLINLLMNVFAVCGLHVAFGFTSKLGRNAEYTTLRRREQEPTGNMKSGESDSSEQIPSCLREMSAFQPSLDPSRANRLVAAVNILISSTMI